MAIKQRKSKETPLIHHSDRGLCNIVRMITKTLNKTEYCQMTQNSDPYENAVAERINGILKQKFDKYNLDFKMMKQIRISQYIQ
jgi:hypothetical protein